MSQRIYLGLAIHNHQPVGNFHSVFEQAYRQAYLPLVEALERHPAVRLSLHYSGSLIDWLEAHHPQFFPSLAALVARGQVEIMGGAYYEPILPLIPEADQRGQIALTQEALSRLLHCPGEGLWLAERVWESHLPKVLAQAGVGWTVVDDIHFRLSGLAPDQLFGYYLTEEQGHYLKVFPSLKSLRYLIPWRPVAEVIAYLKEHASSANAIAVMGDDGEKFGIWPKTYEHCWQTGWMEAFFQAIEDNQDWLSPIPLGEYSRKFKPRGLVYLPNASYPEMMEWSLPLDRQLHFQRLKEELNLGEEADIYLRGGFFRYFLQKYPEANLLHKKMLRVHNKVYYALSIGGKDARRELWQGQCNCPYWHGIFGGLYLNDIRSANYRHLLEAERLAQGAISPMSEKWLEVNEEDWDGDGEKELLLEGNRHSIYLTPASGGCLIEWDLYKKGHNLLSTLARHAEAYHLSLLQQGEEEVAGVHTIHHGLKMKQEARPTTIPKDSYSRFSLRDHLLPLTTNLESFALGQYEELAGLATAAYQFEVKHHQEATEVRLEHKGEGLRIEKRLHLRLGEEGLEVEYHLANERKEGLHARFGSEWNINLLAGGGNPQAYYEVKGAGGLHPGKPAQLPPTDKLVMGNRWLGLRLTLKIEPKAYLWLYPVETFSLSEDGVERVYQGSCIFPWYEVDLAPGQSLAFRFTWQVE